jgi:hypothetical protein
MVFLREARDLAKAMAEIALQVACRCSLTVECFHAGSQRGCEAAFVVYR